MVDTIVYKGEGPPVIAKGSFAKVSGGQAYLQLACGCQLVHEIGHRVKMWCCEHGNEMFWG